MLTFHPLQEKAPPHPPLRGRFCFLFLISNKPPTMGWFRSPCSWEPGSVLRGKGAGGGARDAPKLLGRGGGGSRQPAGRRGLEPSLPPRPRLRRPPGTRGSFHCCTSAVAMLEGESLDLRSLHSAGHRQTPGRALAARAASYLCLLRASVRDPTWRVLGDAGCRLRSPRRPRHPGAPAAHRQLPGRSPLHAASAGPGPSPRGGGEGRKGHGTGSRGRRGALRAKSVREPAESGHPG